MTATIGISGLVTSWANHAALLSTLFKPMAFTLTGSGNSLDQTGFVSGGALYRSNLPGLRSYTAAMRGYGNNTVTNGVTGAVTFGDGYVVNAFAWDLEVSWEEHDVTAYNGTGVTDMAWLPGLARWSGSWQCYVDGTTAVSNMTASTGTAGSATFKLKENAAGTDDTFVGTIIVTGVEVVSEVGGKNVVRYTFVGAADLTADGDNLGASSTGIFDTDGTLIIPTAGALVLQAATGRTYTADAFATRARWSHSVAGIVGVEATARLTGALTIA